MFTKTIDAWKVQNVPLLNIFTGRTFGEPSSTSVSATREAANPPFALHSNDISSYPRWWKEKEPLQRFEKSMSVSRRSERREGFSKGPTQRYVQGKITSLTLDWLQRIESLGILCLFYTLLMNTVLIPELVIGRERLVWVLMPRTSLTGMRRTMRIWLEGESHMWKSTRCTYHNP